MFLKAVKSQSKLRLALVGPSGSGKTFSSLAIATGLGQRIAVLDTEHGSASKYADKFNFDVVQLSSFHPREYINVIQAASNANYDVLIIDSLSHAWIGKDGALEQVDRIAKKSQSSNSFAAWRDVTPMHNQMVEAMLACKCHLIATMRAKTDYVLEPNEKGKMVPRKVGLAPIQRDGLEYEFDVVGDMNLENEMIVGKSRCSALSGQIIAQPGLQLADTLKKWLLDGTPISVPQQVVVATNGNPHNERVRGVRTLLGIEAKAVLEWLKTEMLVKTPAELDLNQVDQLIESMAVQWAVKQGMQHNHALNSFHKYIPAIIKEGYNEVDAIGLWMEHVQQQAVQKLSISVG
ncbi:MAG: ATP-binding protein [Rhizonema sp. PD37]|nr:ATP-binding protein [Rhizonema sp. PD37]